MCGSDTEYYYLPDQEAAKLEAELTQETFTINDMYVESKLLFDCQDKLNDLQIENKQLKEKCKSEYQRGIEDGKIIAEHGTTMYQD